MSSIAAFVEQVFKISAILLDDVVMLAKPAISRIGDTAMAAKMAASATTDDVIPLAKMATKKASAVVVDDTAVSSDQLNASSIAQNREYAVWRKIVASSLVNKVIILTIILVAGAVAPVIPQVLLALGASYLAFEGAHKLMEYVHHLRAKVCRIETVAEQADIKELPQAGRAATWMPLWLDRFLGTDAGERNVLTDLILLDAILSTEILLVANGSLGEPGLVVKIVSLLVVALATTIGVYGIVLLIVRLDNIAGYFAQAGHRLYMPRVAKALMSGLPYALKLIGFIGTTAMLGVAGEVSMHLLPTALSACVSAEAGEVAHHFLAGISQWLIFLPVGAEAVASMIIGAVFGFVLILCGVLVHLLKRKTAGK